MLEASYLHPTWKAHGKPCSDCLNMFLAHDEFKKNVDLYIWLLFLLKIHFLSLKPNFLESRLHPEMCLLELKMIIAGP